MTIQSGAVGATAAQIQEIKRQSLGIDMFRRASSIFKGMFGGRRNLYDVFGYDPNPSYQQRLFKYMRQDIAARIVDAPASALWTNPPLVTSTDPVWNELWDDLIARFNLFSNVERVDKLAGIGRFSLLLIGFNDGGRLDTPVNTRAITQKDEKILYLQPYGEGTVKIKAYNQDPSSSDFMKPLIYTIFPMDEVIVGWDRNTSGNAKLNSSFDVHASRVVHVAENILENSVYGSPRMERVYNILDDILKVTGGSAETYWLIANRGLHIDIDKELDIDPTDAKNLADEISDYTNQLTRVIRTRGTKVNSLGSDTPDPSGVFKMLVATLSGATGIPQRIIIGSEAGQLASEQDRANWADRIDERRANFGNPNVLFPVIKKLARSGYFSSDPNLQITVEWPNAFKMSPLENAQTSAQHARSATNFAKAIETMHNLNMGTPAVPGGTDPLSGKVSPGTPEVPGADLGDLITVPEARKMMWLDKPPVTFDSGVDVNDPKARAQLLKDPVRIYSRRVDISLGRIMRI